MLVAFIADTIKTQGITADVLTIHADRGTSMTSKPVAVLLAELGVTRTHSRPHVSKVKLGVAADVGWKWFKGIGRRVEHLREPAKKGLVDEALILRLQSGRLAGGELVAKPPSFRCSQHGRRWVVMDRTRSPKRVRRTVAGLLLAATMAVGASAVVSDLTASGPAHPTAGIRWDAARAGSVAMGVAPGVIPGPMADGIRWS